MVVFVAVFVVAFMIVFIVVVFVSEFQFHTVDKFFLIKQTNKQTDRQTGKFQTQWAKGLAEM